MVYIYLVQLWPMLSVVPFGNATLQLWLAEHLFFETQSNMILSNEKIIDEFDMAIFKLQKVQSFSNLYFLNRIKILHSYLSWTFLVLIEILGIFHETTYFSVILSNRNSFSKFCSYWNLIYSITHFVLK